MKLDSIPVFLPLFLIAISLLLSGCIFSPSEREKGIIDQLFGGKGAEKPSPVETPPAPPEKKPTETPTAAPEEKPPVIAPETTPTETPAAPDIASLFPDNSISFSQPLDPSDISIQTTDTDRQLIAITGMYSGGEPYTPMLPMKTYSVLVPNGRKVSSLEVFPHPVQTITVPNIEVNYPPLPAADYPTPAEMSSMTPEELKAELEKQFGDQIPPQFLDKNGNVITTPLETPQLDEKIAKRDAFYPYKYYDYMLQDLNGYDIAIITLYPVQYNPVSGVAKFSSLDVKINLKLKDYADTPKTDLESLERLDMRVDKIASYDKALESYAKYSNPQQGGGENPLTAVSPNTTYIIITNQSYNGTWNGACGSAATLMSGLVKQKKCRPNSPMNASIYTVQWIVSQSNYSCNSPYIVSLGTSVGMNFSDNHCDVEGHNDDAAKVRNFIRDAYVTGNTRYILLAGDADGEVFPGVWGVNHETEPVIVPVRYLPVPYSTGPADAYFANLDGSYDYNGNGIFGEDGFQFNPKDGVNGGYLDYLAEVYVGRVTVDSTDRVNNFVAKTIAHENSLNAPSNALMVGEYMQGSGIFTNLYMFSNPVMDVVHEGSMDWQPVNNGTGGIPGQISTIYDRPDYSFSKWDIINRLNQNDITQVHNGGHGSVNSIMELANALPGSGNNDLRLINNTNYFLGYSESCGVGSFDNSFFGDYNLSVDSITERMVKDTGKAYAYIANSRYGLLNAPPGGGVGAGFHREFVDSLYAEGIYTLGRALQDSKEDSFPANHYSSWSTDRKIYFDLNLLGDPETPVYNPTQNPLADVFLVRSQTLDNYDYSNVTFIYNGTVTLEGIARAATGRTLDHYTLDYRLEGDSSWANAGITLAGNGNSPVYKGTLGTWDTTYARDGKNEIRLTVTDTTGASSNDTMKAVINNVYFSDNASQFVRNSGPVEYYGHVVGPTLQSYTLQYGIGLNPEQWLSDHISLVNGGNGERNNQLLGTWDTSFISSAGYYTLKLTALYSNKPAETELLHIYVDPSYMASFPKRAGTNKNIYAPAVIADINGDGGRELLFNELPWEYRNDVFSHSLGPNNTFHALSASGQEISGWPLIGGARNNTGFGSLSSPSIGVNNVIFTGNTNSTYGGTYYGAIARQGTGALAWVSQVSPGISFISTPLLADLDGNGILEAVVTSTATCGRQACESGQMFAFHSNNGTLLAGWPKPFVDFTILPAVGDVNNDGRAEIFYYDNSGGAFYLLNSSNLDVAGWPKYLGMPNNAYAATAIGDMNGDGTPDLVGTFRNSSSPYFNIINTWNYSGSVISTFSIPYSYDTYLYSLVLARNGNSSNPMVYVAFHNVTSQANVLRVYNSQGNLTGTHQNAALREPVLADIDGDGRNELLQYYCSSGTAEFCNLTAKDAENFANNNNIPGWPKVVEGGDQKYTSPTVADFNNDGLAEVILATTNYVYIWPTNQPYGNATGQWPMYRSNMRHTGNLADNAQEQLEIPAIPINCTPLGQTCSPMINTCCMGECRSVPECVTDANCPAPYTACVNGLCICTVDIDCPPHIAQNYTCSLNIGG